jgi:hypothetical protein
MAAVGGSISGSVADKSGAVVAGAVLKLVVGFPLLVEDRFFAANLYP